MALSKGGRVPFPVVASLLTLPFGSGRTGRKLKCEMKNECQEANMAFPGDVPQSEAGKIKETSTDFPGVGARTGGTDERRHDCSASQDQGSSHTGAGRRVELELGLVASEGTSEGGRRTSDGPWQKVPVCDDEPGHMVLS